ncbi:hypothetical protein WJX79_006123 [Trebouxia sp. C0005]
MCRPEDWSRRKLRCFLWKWFCIRTTTAAYARHGFTQMRYCFAPESWQLHHGFIAIGKTNVSEQELQDFMMTRLHMRQEEMNTGKKFKTEHKTKRNNKRKQCPVLMHGGY